jgi:hypothetical protein
VNFDSARSLFSRTGDAQDMEPVVGREPLAPVANYLETGGGIWKNGDNIHFGG